MSAHSNRAENEMRTTPVATRARLAHSMVLTVRIISLVSVRRLLQQIVLQTALADFDVENL